MKECPKCKSKQIIGIEYSHLEPEHYDGVSEWMCAKCEYRQGRWSGKELLKGQMEYRFGKER